MGCETVVWADKQAVRFVKQFYVLVRQAVCADKQAVRIVKQLYGLIVRLSWLRNRLF